MHKVVRVSSQHMFPVVKEMLDEGKKVSITVTGNSMYPFLRNGIDIVELTKADFSRISRGDIVLIRRDSGVYVLHRVLRKEKDCFYMAGDNQQWIEGPLRPDQLIAVTTAIIRGGRKISCNNLIMKFLVGIWLLMLPVRHKAMKVLAVPYRAIRKIIK